MNRVAGTRGSLAAAFVGALAIFVAASAMVVLRTNRHNIAPDDTSLAAAARILGRDVQKGDAIAFHPEWSASQKWRFAEAYRKAGLAYDQALIVGDPTDLWDADGWKRMWVVSTHNRAGSLKLPTRRLRAEDLDHGTELLLFDLGTSRTSYDLRKHLADAVVEREEPPGTPRRCTWTGQKHSCGGEWWLDVVDGVQEVGGSRHNGIMVQPGNKSGVVRLTWPRPAGARALAGRVGLRLWAVRNDVGSAVKVQAKVGDRAVWSIALPRADFAWHPFEVALHADEAGKPITFEFSATDAGWRQVAFDARLLDATPIVVSQPPPVAPPAAPALAPALPAPSPAIAPTAPPPRQPSSPPSSPSAGKRGHHAKARHGRHR